MFSLPLHPFLVHFPVALWFVGTLFLSAALSAKGEKLLLAGWVLLGLAAVSAIFAAVSGQASLQAAQQSPPELGLHQQLGNLMPWLMNALVLFRLHHHFRKSTRKVPTIIWTLLAWAICFLLFYAAHQGGILVYRYGIGVAVAVG